MFTSISTHPIIQHAPGLVSQNQPNHASTLIILTLVTMRQIWISKSSTISSARQKRDQLQKLSKKKVTSSLHHIKVRLRAAEPKRSLRQSPILCARSIRRIFFTRLSLSLLMSPIFPLYTRNLY
jgi:hypothetical protein